MSKIVEEFIQSELDRCYKEEKERGYKEGYAEGRAEATVFAIHAVMAEFSISADDAMQMLQVPEADKETYRKLLNQ